MSGAASAFHTFDIAEKSCGQNDTRVEGVKVGCNGPQQPVLELERWWFALKSGTVSSGVEQNGLKRHLVTTVELEQIDQGSHGHGRNLADELPTSFVQLGYHHCIYGVSVAEDYHDNRLTMMEEQFVRGTQSGRYIDSRRSCVDGIFKRPCELVNSRICVRDRIRCRVNQLPTSALQPM